MICIEKEYLSNSPQDWIIREKSLATVGQTFNAKVITGNATAPPPSEVIPKKLKQQHKNYKANEKQKLCQETNLQLLHQKSLWCWGHNLECPYDLYLKKKQDLLSTIS